MLKTFKRDNHGILYKEKYIYNRRKVEKRKKRMDRKGLAYTEKNITGNK